MSSQLAIIINVPRRYTRKLPWSKGAKTGGSGVMCLSRQAAVAWAKRVGLKLYYSGYHQADEATRVYVYEPD
jgi:hypothetical protein